jgi:UDP-galactopyranose mutase
MNIQKHFEVKTGKNKGFYIVTKRKHLDPDTYNEIAKTYGIIVYEYNPSFYQYHRVNPYTELIWTHTRFAGHEFNRKIYTQLLQKGGCNLL